MGYYKINIVAEKLVDNYFYVYNSFSVYQGILNKDEIEDLWQYIEPLAAKQKLRINSCFICENGLSVTPKVTTATRQVKPLVEAYCLMFKPRHKYMQMTFITPRTKFISVCITYRKEQRRAV